MHNNKKMSSQLISFITLLFITVFGSIPIMSCGGSGGGGGDGASSHTALCNDGTYSDSMNCSGTCSHHDGVKTWYVNCGSAEGQNVIIIDDKKTVKQSTGLYYGTWIDNEEDETGTLSLNIAEDGIVDGILTNKDNTIDSELYSDVDSNGIVGVYLDAQSSFDKNSTIQYPTMISLKNVNDQLIGIITIQSADREQIKKIELNRE
jgi:hypothetical protein